MTAARRISLSVVIVALAAAVLSLALFARADAVRMTTPTPDTLLFVCQNGVAMSVWSALTFNRLAAQRGLTERASSRAASATFAAVPANMQLALLIDGLLSLASCPRNASDGPRRQDCPARARCTCNPQRPRELAMTVR
jgi:hypothetical protein